MSINAIKQKIQELSSSPQSIAVMYFMLRDANGHRLRKVELSDRAQLEVTREVIIELEIYFEEEYVLRDLTNADQRDNAIYEYNLSDIPSQLQLLMDAYRDRGQVEGFDHVNDSLSDLKAIILTVGNGVETLAIYKYHYPTNTYRRSGFSLLRAGMAQDRFEKLEQDIIRLSHAVDFLFDGSQIYVTTFKVLEKFFGFKEAVKRQAADHLNQLAARDIIENVGDLAERINVLGDITFAKKVIRALSHSPVLQTVTNEQIIQFVKTHHTLAKKIRINDEDTKFVLETKISQNFFMKLLNDDFLKSELTNFEYDANSKDVVEVEAEVEE